MEEPPGDANARHSTVRRIVDLLAAGDFETLDAICQGLRLKASDLETAVREYGATLVSLPPEADALVEYTPIRNANPSAWSVVVPLFSREEGRSDLSLELTLTVDDDGGFSVQLDDLHVL